MDTEETDTLRQFLTALWDKTTDLFDSERSPLTQAIIQECMEAAEPNYRHSDMARAMALLADDCQVFASALREAE